MKQMLVTRIVQSAVVGCVGVTVLASAGAVSAAPAAKKKASAPATARPASQLKSLEVVPGSVKLVGPRAVQGLIVTGKYADGSIRDLTHVAKFTVGNPKLVTLSTDNARPDLRPLADGSTGVIATVGSTSSAKIPVVISGCENPQPVSFRDEVIPALTKAGCSMGTCHGTPTGKGGFRLSLQGYAPELDYLTLVNEGGSRRVNKRDPGRSLLLLKAMAEVPHGGGKRLSEDMPEFQVLSQWIAEGARDDAPDKPELERVEILPNKRVLMLPHGKQQVTAMAHFSDGSVRDVTHLAKLETSDEEVATITREGLVQGADRGEIAVVVRYQHLLQSSRLTFLKEIPGFKWNNPPANNFVDQHVYNRLKLFKIPASDLSTDNEFVRRAYLDGIGMLPTLEEVRAFLNDANPNKRARLIEELTNRPEFADFWALKWSDVLRVQDETMKETGAKAYHQWIRDSIHQGKPMDQFVREILTADGPGFSNPPANFYLSFKEPDEFSQATAQLFLGVRMSCAKCHNHPFERWTQDEYYQLAAFFSQVRRKGGPSKDEETVYLNPKGEVQHLRTGAVMQPKFLGADFPEIAPGEDRREALAKWMTAKDNPFFAKAIVNRVWSHLVGRGIVEPIDDFRESNPPVNDELLEALAKDFVNHNFDLKHLVRTVMNSRTYQLSARTEPLNKSDDKNFSHAFTRRLTAEQLSDAITAVTGVPEAFPGYPEGTRAMQVAGTKARTRFLQTFGRPNRNLNCECERENGATLFQALALISGRSLDTRLRNDKGRIAEMAASQKSDAELIDEMYLRAFCRPPTAKEKASWLTYFKQGNSRREVLEDLGWVLINSKEFLFRY